jgi:hypothetical protein
MQVRQTPWRLTASVSLSLPAQLKEQGMLELADDTQDARLALTPIITLVHIPKWVFCLRRARFLLCYRLAADIFYCQQP